MGSIERKLRRDRAKLMGRRHGRPMCGWCKKYVDNDHMGSYDVNGRVVWTGCMQCSNKHRDSIQAMIDEERQSQAEDPHRGVAAVIEARAQGKRSARHAVMSAIAMVAAGVAILVGMAALSAYDVRVPHRGIAPVVSR